MKKLRKRKINILGVGFLHIAIGEHCLAKICFFKAGTDKVGEFKLAFTYIDTIERGIIKRSPSKICPFEGTLRIEGGFCKQWTVR